MGTLFNWQLLFRKIFLVILVVCFVGQEVCAGKASAEETEPSNGGGSSSKAKSEKYTSGASADKYSASYPSSAYNYYSNYGYPGVPSYPFANGAGGAGAEYGKSNGYSSYFTEPVYDRGGKDFSPRTSHNMPMTMAATSNFGSYGGPSHVQQSKEVTAPEYGGMASASGDKGWASGGHGWGKGWGGGGGGWGGGWGGGPSKSDNGKILGALALIGLLSLFSNVMNTMSTTAATTTMAAGRRRRDVIGDDGTEDASGSYEDALQKRTRISLMVLPSLNVIAHARNGRVPLECTHREVCVTNSILVKEFGPEGRISGTVLSSAITKLLKEQDKSGTIGKHLDRASLAGRDGHDCTVIYPLCDALGKNSRPLPMLLSPQQIADVTREKPVQIQSSRPSNGF